VKLFKYIRYFLFLYSNWSLRISFFILRHEIRGEKKYDINTTGYDELEYARKKGFDISHSTFYMPVNYYMLEVMLQEAQMLPGNKSILDIGCGRGRVMAVAAYFDFKIIWGVDFDPVHCAKTRANLVKVRERFPAVTFEVIEQDAAMFPIPAEVSVIFLFNPFDQLVMRIVIRNILDSQARLPRTIWVIYVNPELKNLLEEVGFREIYRHRKLGQLQGCIFEKRPIKGNEG
jgi:predicted RNA methylase